jgi:hypothetical protein
MPMVAMLIFIRVETLDWLNRRTALMFGHFRAFRKPRGYNYQT